MTTLDEQTALSLRQQHDAFAKLLLEFYEWRHKIMTRFAVVIGALVVAVRSLTNDGGPPLLVVATLIAGAIFCGITTLMDRINQDIIELCYRHGREVELQLGMDQVGLFHGLQKRFEKRPTPAFSVAEWLSQRKLLTYRFLLRVLYLSCGATALGIAAFIAMNELFGS
jgi:hypothetical protein